MSTLGNMSKEVVEKYINDQKYTETNKSHTINNVKDSTGNLMNKAKAGPCSS